MSSRSSLQIASTSAHASASTVTSLSTLSDPPTRLMDAAAMDYFLIELVPTLRRSARVATERRKALEKEMVEAGLIPPPAPPPKADKPRESQGQGPRDSTTSLNAKVAKMVLDEDEESVRVRLEAIGTHVGANFAERLCLNRPLFTETLDAIKFICKDVWVAYWDKQVDNLRTNHRGVYVLQDNLFKPISRLSSWEGRADALKKSKIYVALAGGIIKGTLLRLGYQATVVPEINSLPQCTFQVKLPKGS